MKQSIYISITIVFAIMISILTCTSYSESTNKLIQNLPIDRIVLDSLNKEFGYYCAVPPLSENIEGVLLLFPGFTQKSEDIFRDSKLPNEAYHRDFLTIGFAGRARITADSLLTEKINAVVSDVVKRYSIGKDKFVLGGFSAGGTIAMRYTERCKADPDKFPINPAGLFMVDAPVDLFYSWKFHEENIKHQYSSISLKESETVERVYRHYNNGTPSEIPDVFKKLSPFSMDKTLGENELSLKNTAIRAYHDVDISWRLKNRNQSVRNSNYIVTSELINRLQLLGNDKAEFMQTFQTGYRKNGNRHPHSWSIVDEMECINWIKTIIK